MDYRPKFRSVEPKSNVVYNLMIDYCSNLEVIFIKEFPRFISLQKSDKGKLEKRTNPAVAQMGAKAGEKAVDMGAKLAEKQMEMMGKQQGKVDKFLGEEVPKVLI